LEVSYLQATEGGTRMAFEDYKDLDGRPEKASKEEIEALRRKYGVDEEFASRRPAEKKDAKE